MEMERQQTSPTVIQRRFKLNPNKDAIIDGAHITEYELTNHPSQVYFSGRIYFEDGQEKGARFFKFKESEEKRAKKILLETSKINHKTVLKAYFAAYYEPESLWILCYDWFDSLLDDNDDVLLPARDECGLLCCFWSTEIIGSVLEAIKKMHFSRLFHMNLNDTRSYVFVSERIKIVNVQGSFDPKDDVDPAEIHKLRIEDLKAFRNMLKNRKLMPGVCWADRDGFFDFFDIEIYTYPTFVDKLRKHPFLCTPKERMKSFSDIWHSLNESDTRREEYKKLLDDGEEFQQYKNTWNDTGNMSKAFECIYKFKKNSYKGDSVWDLLRFVRNVYEHYREHNISVEDADCEVRKLYPNFLDKVYAHLLYSE